MKYAFIQAHLEEFGIRAMRRVLRGHFSGFYAWLKNSLSQRAQEDIRQTELIRQAWADSGKVYGYRKLTDDLRDQGESICLDRAARLTRLAGIAAQVGYKRRPGRYGGMPAIVAENTLEQQFHASQPDQVWVTDITYIKTHEGWLYLCVVIDLFSRVRHCSRTNGASMAHRRLVRPIPDDHGPGAPSPSDGRLATQASGAGNSPSTTFMPRAASDQAPPRKVVSGSSPQVRTHLSFSRGEDTKPSLHLEA